MPIAAPPELTVDTLAAELAILEAAEDALRRRIRKLRADLDTLMGVA